MNKPPRFAINRTAVLLVPREPFLEWLNDTDPSEEPLTMEDLFEDNNIFMIPRFDDESRSIKWIERYWDALFEYMLSEWVTEESLWPQERTLDLFREWFDVEIHTLVWDLSDDSLQIEDWQDDEGESSIENEKIVFH